MDYKKGEEKKMRKLITILLALTIALTLSGCEREKKDMFTTGIEDVIEYNC